MFNPYDIIYSVKITEKSTALADKFNRYTFKVNPKSNKIEIKQAVEAIFDDVEVKKVNVMNYSGKMRRMRSARYGKRSDWKKAMVTLKEGGKIEML